MKLKHIIFIAILAMLASCRGSRVTPVLQQVHTTEVESRETQEQIIDYSRADSAEMVVALGVDDLGQVTLQSITDFYPGDNVKPEIKIRDNYIHVKCRVDSAEVYRRYSRLFIINADTSSRTSIISAPGVSSTRSREAGFFHRTIHTAGYLFLAELLILAVYFILKLRKLFSIF